MTHRSGANVVRVLPHLIVGSAAMTIRYATLVDVARTNGLPLPVLFPLSQAETHFGSVRQARRNELRASSVQERVWPVPRRGVPA